MGVSTEVEQEGKVNMNAITRFFLSRRLQRAKEKFASWRAKEIVYQDICKEDHTCWDEMVFAKAASKRARCECQIKYLEAKLGLSESRN